MSRMIAGTIVEDSGATVLAYVLAADGTPLVVADISSMSYSVYEISEAGVATVVAAHNAVSLTPADVVFDTLVTSATDSRWTYSGTGYNFKHSIAYTAFATPNVKYRYEVRIVETGGARYWVRGQFDVDGVFTS